MNSADNPRKLSTEIKLLATDKDEASETSLEEILERKVKKIGASERIGRLAIKPVGSKLNYNIYNR
jgi:hypothetical protein